MFFINGKATAFYFACILVFKITSTPAQVHAPVYRELIIELPELSADKDLNSIVISLGALNGIHYEGYCSQMKCLLLKVDENIHPANDAIMNKLKEKTSSFFIKPTGKIHQVLENCKDPILPNNDSEPVENSPEMR